MAVHARERETRGSTRWHFPPPQSHSQDFFFLGGGANHEKVDLSHDASRRDVGRVFGDLVVPFLSNVNCLADYLVKQKLIKALYKN